MAEMDGIGELFTRILVRSERRGPYATGVALVNSGGDYCVSKAPIPAGEFVSSNGYRQVLSRLDGETTLLMGHTRWPTRGSHLDNANNHPLVSECDLDTASGGRSRKGACLLTHNGHIGNANLLFRALGLRCETQVDSEILLRLAERNLMRDGLDLGGLADDLSLCRGRLSCVIAATNNPTEIVLVKGNQPLEFRYSRHHQVLLYASEAEFLDDALGEKKGWVEWQIPSMRMIVVSADCLSEPTVRPFHFGDPR